MTHATIPAARIYPDTPAGTWVVCCHHKIPVEVLTEPAGNRSRYIEDHKPAHERPTRHAAFRALASWAQLPQPVLDAWRAYADAGRAYADAKRAYNDALRAYNDAGRAYNDAWRARDDAWRARNDAWRAYNDTLRAHLPAVLALVQAEHPDLPVDWTTGHLIFPQP